MSYQAFGPDPTLYAMIKSYSDEIIGKMVQNGTINQQIGASLAAQVGANQQYIANAICSAAQQNGVGPTTHEVVNETLKQWIGNLYQTIMARMVPQQQMYGGYQPQPQFNGYGYGYGYGNTGMAPWFQQQQPMYQNYQYGQYGMPQQNGYANVGYVQQETQTATQSANANRFAAGAPRVPTSQGSSNPVIPNKVQEQDPNIDFQPPKKMGEIAEISNAYFDGTTANFRWDVDKYLTCVCGFMKGMVTSAEDVYEKIKDTFGNYQAYFAHVRAVKPVVLNAPRSEVVELISKYEAMFKSKNLTLDSSPSVIEEIFTNFYMKFMQEKSEAAKALNQYFVDEFNAIARSKYMLYRPDDNLAIKSLEHIIELYSKTTKNKAIQLWQTRANFFTVLGKVVKLAIFDLFLQEDNYRLLAFGNDADREVICNLFKDETVGGLSVSNALMYYKKGVDQKHIDNADEIKTLFNSLMEKTVIGVPRYYIFSNYNPSFWISGDYANPSLNRTFASATNNLEFFLIMTDKMLKKVNSPHVNEMSLAYGSVKYKLTYGISTDSNYMVSMGN